MGIAQLINEAAKTILRNSHQFEEEPKQSDCIKYGALLPQVEEKVSAPSTTIDNVLQKILGKYRLAQDDGTKKAIQNINDTERYWITPEQKDEDPDFKGIGEDYDLLQKRAKSKSSVSKAELLKVITCKMEEKDRDVHKKDISLILDQLKSTIQEQVKEGGSGIFTFPGILTIRVEEKTRNITVEPLEGLIRMARPDLADPE